MVDHSPSCGYFITCLAAQPAAVVNNTIVDTLTAAVVNNTTVETLTMSMSSSSLDNDYPDPSQIIVQLPTSLTSCQCQHPAPLE